MELGTRVRYLSKLALRPLLYRHAPIGLQPERLYLWMRTLLETREVPGAVLEIGCSAGGTAATCARLVRRVGPEKPYVCVDTFDGFVPQQFNADTTDASHQDDFSASSLRLVRRIVDGLGAPQVHLVQGDIEALPTDRLPGEVSACLVDVDLSGPVRAALEKVWPRLAPGGIIVVDDCPEGYDWEARDGYEAFCADHGMEPRYELGMGLVAH